MLVKRANGWTYDTQDNVFTAGELSGKLPEVSLHALAHFGLGYLDSQAASRTVQDNFRKRWVEARGGKAKDAPKDAVPSPDSDAYRAELAKVHRDYAEKLLAGYEVGVREGSVDPVEVEADNIAREWLQHYMASRPTPWYVSPGKSAKRAARDDDALTEVGRAKTGVATFGDALARFMTSSAPALRYAKAADGKQAKDVHGHLWPFRFAKDETVADAIAREAAARVAAKGAPSVTLADSDDDEGL